MAETRAQAEVHPRIDLREKVTGQARFVEDLPNLPLTAYGATLLSPYSHARILRIDSAAAERAPGVLAVLDREHLEGINPRLKVARHEHLKLNDDQDFIAIDKVRFDGERVAAVVAEDLRSAERAIKMIHVQYEPLPAVFDAVTALAANAPLVHEERGTNLLFDDRLEWGDIEEGLRQADRVFEEIYTSPSMFHHPMENIGGCLAQYVNGEINLWLPTSSPTRDASEIAQFMGVESDKVRVRGMLQHEYGVKLDEISTYKISLIWFRRPVAEQKTVLGDDPWPYGLAKNRHGVATLMNYLYEQGLVKEQLEVDQLFAPNTLDLYGDLKVPTPP